MKPNLSVTAWIGLFFILTKPKKTMAKGQTIGLLNFGIGGDDAEIQKIFEKQKKQAKELQDLYKSIGFGNAKEQL